MNGSDTDLSWPPGPPARPSPLVPWARRIGFGGLGAALALAITAIADSGIDLEGATRWWRAWVFVSAVLLFAFPITMLILWRNGDRVPVRDADGQPVLDPRGRPRMRRVDRPGSQKILVGLTLQAAGLMVLVASLLMLVLRG